MKIIVVLLSFILTPPCFAQFKLTKLGKNSIPKNIKYLGNLVQAGRWSDSTGDNIIILTAEKTRSKNNYGADGALYAYHYRVFGDSIKQTWRVYDYVKECDADMFLYFVDKSFRVTDLNKDGKAEVWIMYKNSCQGDVSPVPMKIIMYEDNKKFAVRGTTKVQVSDTEHAGGEFIFDDAFKKGPTEFRQYAENLWKQHRIETWGQ